MNTSSRPQILLASLLLAAVAIGVHIGTTGGDFTSWDDEFYVTGNLRIQHPTPENLGWFFTHPYINSYTPLSFMSHAVDWALWGSDPRGHHWHSLLLHACNTVLVFFLALEILRRYLKTLPPGSILIGAAAAALLFSVHPLRVESVAWISDRKDLLSSFFALICAIAWFRWSEAADRRKRLAWCGVSFFCFTAALLSKFLSVFLPVTLLAAELSFRPAKEWKHSLPGLLRRLLLFAAPAAIVLWFAFTAVGTEPAEFRAESVTLLQRLSLFFASPWFYLKKLAVPANLSPLYNFPLLPSTWLAAIPILAITALAVWGVWKGRNALFGSWAAYLLLLCPTFLAINPLLQHTADRHSYLPTIPLFLLAGGGIALLWRNTYTVEAGRIVRMTFALLLLIFAGWHSAISIRQAGVWKNNLTLWSQAITVSPELPMSYTHLGDAVLAAGNTEDAMVLYRRATQIEEAFGHAWTRIGILSELKGDPVGAERAYRKSIVMNPEYVEAFINLGDLMKGRGDDAGAAEIYRKGLAITPGNGKLLVALGNTYLDEGKADSALICHSRALGGNTLSPDAEWGVARSLEQLGKKDAALLHARIAAELGNREAARHLQHQP